MATTRDAGDQTPAGTWRDRHGVRLSEHAADRWDERMPDDTIAPETAFERGVEVPAAGMEIVRTAESAAPDGARVWMRGDGLTAVFPIEEDPVPTIVTVKRVDYWFDWAERLYLKGVFVDGGGFDE